ncbi:MAG: carbon-nitrogen hydrolase family protein [Acidobacteria bacterium]|nr:carbon-nitrogen hydrolase family protein [Acidobacteriota bacterium]
MTGKVKVAVVQSSPVFMNLEASLVKATDLMAQAAKQGVKILAFGETWLPGYPAWLDYCPDAALWNHQPTKEVFARLRQNSVVVPGRETKILGEAAADLRLVLVIGINERVESGPGNGTLYNSLLTFGADGKLVNHHRKLVPTYTERLVWGQGDGAGLIAVETTAGRVGGLVCWEHWMPLARQALHISGEHIHVAVWPTVHEMHQVASRHYAFEARCFVLAAGLIMRVKDLPDELSKPAELSGQPDALLLRGGSCIIGPDGRYIAGPVFDEEIILTAALDLVEIDMEKMTLDVAGHYHRPDVFNLQLRKGTRTEQ